MPARWWKVWLVVVTVYTVGWSALAVRYRIDQRAVTRTVLADLEWARATERPSDSLRAMLDAAGAPPLSVDRGHLDPSELAELAISERVIGSERITRLVHERVVMPRAHVSHGKACIAVAAFAFDLSERGAADAVRVAARLLASVDAGCANGLTDVDETDLARLTALASRSINSRVLFERELSLSRRADYRSALVDRDPLLHAEMTPPLDDVAAEAPLRCGTGSSDADFVFGLVAHLASWMSDEPRQFLDRRRQLATFWSRHVQDSLRASAFGFDLRASRHPSDVDAAHDAASQAMRMDVARVLMLQRWLRAADTEKLAANRAP